jgi:hypothetical protein
MLKIRASKLGAIMTDSKTPNKDPLGATCRSALRDIWIADNYRRVRDFTNAMIEKGNANENEGIKMLSLKYRDLFLKNEQHFENDYFTGTPDILTDDCIYDVKCSWSLFTFFDAELTKDYHAQGQVYMDLTGIKNYRLCYVLTDTPEKLIQQEISKILYKCADPSLLPDIEQGVRSQMTFNDVSKESRIKVFEFTYDPEFIVKAKSKIDLCRIEYEKFSL